MMKSTTHLYVDALQFNRTNSVHTSTTNPMITPSISLQPDYDINSNSPHTTALLSRASSISNFCHSDRHTFTYPSISGDDDDDGDEYSSDDHTNIQSQSKQSYISINSHENDEINMDHQIRLQQKIAEARQLYASNNNYNNNSDYNDEDETNIASFDELKQQIENKKTKYKYKNNDNNVSVSESELFTECTTDDNIESEDEEEAFLDIFIKCDSGKVLKYGVTKNSSIYHLRYEIDKQTNSDYPLNKSKLYLNTIQCKDAQTFQDLKIKSGSTLTVSCDPIYWTVDDVTQWLVNLCPGFDDYFNNEHWIGFRVDGAELLLNIRAGHFRVDALMNDRDEIIYIMNEINYLRKMSNGYSEEMYKILNAQNKQLKKKANDDKYEIERLQQLIIQNNISNFNKYKKREKYLKKQIKQLKKDKLRLKNEIAGRIYNTSIIEDLKCDYKNDINDNKRGKLSINCEPELNICCETLYKCNSNYEHKNLKIYNNQSALDIKPLRLLPNDYKHHQIKPKKQRKRSFIKNKIKTTNMYDKEDAYAFQYYGHYGHDNYLL